jgi:putative DNA-invertase from lambdoid prophage Rac
MKAAVYLRVSSKDGRQDESNQEPECVRLCAARGWESVLYRERESGAKERPIWKAVIEAARLGQVGAVVFWALDRTGRNRVQVAHDLGELFRFRVHVASVKDSWLDVGPGPLRDLLVQVMAWVAQGERDRLIERTKAGLERARAQGKRLGRPPADAGKVAAAVDRVLRHKFSVGSASRTFGVSRTTIRRAVEVAKKAALKRVAEGA